MSAPVRAKHPRAGRRVIILGGSFVGRTFHVEDWAINVGPATAAVLEAENAGNPLVYGRIGAYGEVVCASHLGPETLS
jgi:hypothetical protein